MQDLGPTISYQCPLECGWHHDAPPPTPDDNPNQYAQAPDETIHDTIARMAGDTARLHRQAVDQALLEHLETHTIPQFVTKLAEQRKAIHLQGEAALETAACLLEGDAWPHERDERENQMLYSLAERIRAISGEAIAAKHEELNG